MCSDSRPGDDVVEDDEVIRLIVVLLLVRVRLQVRLDLARGGNDVDREVAPGQRLLDDVTDADVVVQDKDANRAGAEQAASLPRGAGVGSASFGSGAGASTLAVASSVRKVMMGSPCWAQEDTFARRRHARRGIRAIANGR